MSSCAMTYLPPNHPPLHSWCAGQSEKVTLSQRDVPGMTRSVLPILSTAGVQAISVGVNGASMPPNVPRVFMWRDPVSNVTVPSMWHPHGCVPPLRRSPILSPTVMCGLT